MKAHSFATMLPITTISWFAIPSDPDIDFGDISLINSGVTTVNHPTQMP